MSVKNVIKDRIPYEWEACLRKHKMYTKFVDLVYYGFIPETWRSNTLMSNDYKLSVKRIHHLFNNTTNFLSFINRQSVDEEEYLKWCEINEDIKIHNYNYK